MIRVRGGRDVVALCATGRLGAAMCFSAAVRGGHLDVMKWTWEQECPCDEHDDYKQALVGGHEEMLRWMREEGLFDGYNPDLNHSDDGHSDDGLFAQELHVAGVEDIIGGWW